MFVALALKAKTIATAPEVLLDILIPLLILYGINFLLSTLVGKLLLPRGDAIALVYGSVMRNLSIALAIAINAFGAKGSDAALVIAMAYIIQVQSAACTCASLRQYSARLPSPFRHRRSFRGRPPAALISGLLRRPSRGAQGRGP